MFISGFASILFILARLLHYAVSVRPPTSQPTLQQSRNFTLNAFNLSISASPNINVTVTFPNRPLIPLPETGIKACVAAATARAHSKNPNRPIPRLGYQFTSQGAYLSVFSYSRQRMYTWEMFVLTLLQVEEILMIDGWRVCYFKVKTSDEEGARYLAEGEFSTA